PTIQPRSRHTVPLERGTVDPYGRHSIGEQRVMLALQTVAVLGDIGVPRVAGLYIQPPRSRGELKAASVVEGVEPRVVAIIIRQAVVISQSADPRTVWIDVYGLVVPPRIDVEAQVWKRSRFVREARILAVAQAIGDANYAERWMCREIRTAVRP